MKTVFTAPWGRALKVVSFCVVILLFCIAGAAYRGSGEWWTVLFPLLLLLAVPFIVRGFVVEDGALVILRVGWSMRIPLDDLESVEVDPHAMKGSIRLCGNGGLLSFTGLYRNKKLGNYRAFVSDIKRTVVLRFPKRTIVVSPDVPEAFVDMVEKKPLAKTPRREEL